VSSETTVAKQEKLSAAKLRQLLVTHLKEELQGHHREYEAPLKDRYLEEKLSKALDKLDIAHAWTERSHQIGADIHIYDEVAKTVRSISVKSGTVSVRGKTLCFSGSRLGKAQKKGGIKGMLRSLKENEPDMYICLARNDSSWKKAEEDGSDERTYHLFVFDANLLDYGTDPKLWSEPTKENKKWIRKHGEDTVAVVNPSMSYQLWTTVKYAANFRRQRWTVPKPVDITVKVKTRRKNRQLTLL